MDGLLLESHTGVSGYPAMKNGYISPGRGMIKNRLPSCAVVEVEGVVYQDHRMIIIKEGPRRREEPDGLDDVRDKHGDE